jgi:hypothetical protein
MTGQLRQASMTHACEPFDVRIRRFPRHYRRRLRKLVRGSKPLTDLLYSFPAAAFALAAGGLAPGRSGEAVSLIKSGASLASVAATLDLPLWTRRLPPEAFVEPVGHLPGEADFARQIANFLPAQPERAPHWLSSIAFAHAALGSHFALWLASRRVSAVGYRPGGALLPLAMFIWFSSRDDGPAGQLVERAWTPQMSFAIARSEAQYWLERVVLDHCMDQQPIDGGWYKVQKASGYRFVPLRSSEELREEGDRMNNCVANYDRKAASGACMIYSVRRGGRRVATMEIVPAGHGGWNGRIEQLLGSGNTEPAEDIKRAAATWLAKRGRYPAPMGNRLANLPLQTRRWKEALQPYCAAKPQFGASLLREPSQALARLEADLLELREWREA